MNAQHATAVEKVNDSRGQLVGYRASCTCGWVVSYRINPRCHFWGFDCKAAVEDCEASHLVYVAR